MIWVEVLHTHRRSQGGYHQFCALGRGWRQESHWALLEASLAPGSGTDHTYLSGTRWRVIKQDIDILFWSLHKITFALQLHTFVCTPHTQTLLSPSATLSLTHTTIIRKNTAIQFIGLPFISTFTWHVLLSFYILSVSCPKSLTFQIRNVWFWSFKLFYCRKQKALKPKVLSEKVMQC